MPLTVTSRAHTVSVPLTVTYQTSQTTIVTDLDFFVVTDHDRLFRSCITFSSEQHSGPGTDRLWSRTATIHTESLDSGRTPTEPQMRAAYRRHLGDVSSHSEELHRLLDRTYEGGIRVLRQLTRSAEGRSRVHSLIAEGNVLVLRDIITERLSGLNSRTQRAGSHWPG